MHDRLRNEEWLRLAKGIAVGQTARFPHPGDRTNRPNLVVSNRADRWSAKCMSCKKWGTVSKEHVRYAGKAPADSGLLTHPDDMQYLNTLPSHEEAAVAAFLARKGMDSSMFSGAVLGLSRKRQRLLVLTDQGLLGRDLTDRSPQKWLTYDRTPYLGHPSQHNMLVLVEDPFSYFKMRWAVEGVSPICTLGTNPGLRTIQAVMSANTRKVLICYDGDKPGADGAVQLARRLRTIGLPVDIRLAPWGKDPKDMQAHELQALVQGG